MDACREVTNVVIGASTSCFYPMITELSLHNLMKMGVQNVEIFFNTSSEIERKFIKNLRHEVRRHGAKVKSVHPYSSGMEPFMFFSDYERRFTDMIDTYKRYFEAANMLGAEIVVIHGDKLPARLPDEKYFERFGRIMESGKKYGVCVAQENVNLHRSQSPEFLCRMKEYLGDELKFVFDIKQSVRAGYDPYDFAERVGSGIIHVHTNDNNQRHHCLLPGKGDMDYARLRAILEANGCDPNWIIEVYRKNFDRTEEIIESVRLLTEQLSR